MAQPALWSGSCTGIKSRRKRLFDLDQSARRGQGLCRDWFKGIGVLTMRSLLFVLCLIGSPLAAGTIFQEIDYNFKEGALAGTTVEVRYNYPTLPSGQSLFSYSPDAPATATYLDAFDSSSADLIFSGGADLLDPELYISFAFDPAANSTGLMNFEVWNIGFIGIYFDGDPDIQTYACRSSALECVFSTSVNATTIPLPASAPLLGSALLTGWGVRKRRKLNAAVA
jgi:hypothetical protein